MKFSYLKIRLGEGVNDPIRPRPFIRIKLRASKEASDFIWLYALIDSGADQSVFPVDVARRLNLNLDPSRATRVKGIGGGNIQGWIHPLTVDIDASWSMTFDVVFVDDPQTLPILGQEGFFDNAVVIFNRVKEQIELKPVVQ